MVWGLVFGLGLFGFFWVWALLGLGFGARVSEFGCQEEIQSSFNGHLKNSGQA